MALGVLMSDDRKKDNSRNAVLADDAAALVHDLRTPLLTIRALAALLDDDGAQASPAREIENQLDRLNSRLDAFAQLIAPGGQQGMPESATGTRAAYHVLYVDDDELHRDIGRRMLEQSGCSVILCANGAEALTWCEREHFDLIFLDRNTPIMSGVEAARELAAREGGVVPYMVGMSNDPRGDQMREECMGAGMKDYFAKPLTTEKLAVVLQNISCHQPPEGR